MIKLQRYWRWWVLALALGLATLQGALSFILSVPPVEAATPEGTETHQLYLPLVNKYVAKVSSRLGYSAITSPIDRYPAIRDLRAGWYLNFGITKAPARPLGMEYVQVVRLHQLTTCWPQRLRNRTTCPYVTPYTYTIGDEGAPFTNVFKNIRDIAKANPGSVWFIGNEMDRYDWGDPSKGVPSGGQDEMLPELYARAYHEIYTVIKGADPTARVGIGGVIQATPARLEYLTKMWNEYKRLYGKDMPVDVWNVHNFIFKERCDDYGADVPPGYTQCHGTVYYDGDHDNMQIFDQQIRAFRQWMKARGQQQKPLYVSEYGIVYSHSCTGTVAQCGGAPYDYGNQEVVTRFMLNTFDYFMNTKDCTLGYAADECRLVQRWAWYSLDDTQGYYNEFSALFNMTTKQKTALGQAFQNYAMQHLDP